MPTVPAPLPLCFLQHAKEKPLTAPHRAFFTNQEVQNLQFYLKGSHELRSSFIHLIPLNQVSPDHNLRARSGTHSNSSPGEQSLPSCQEASLLHSWSPPKQFASQPFPGSVTAGLESRFLGRHDKPCSCWGRDFCNAMGWHLEIAALKKTRNPTKTSCQNTERKRAIHFPLALCKEEADQSGSCLRQHGKRW